MKFIPAGKCQFAIVDDDDYARVAAQRWYCNAWGYVVQSVTKQGLSRFIMGDPVGFQVDHINRDKLDNRKANLRCATSHQNQCNRARTIQNKSGFKGVYWDPVNKKWRADIRSHGRTFHLGRFSDLMKAAEAYALAAPKMHGEFARIV